MNKSNIKALKNIDVILVFISIIFLHIFISCQDTTLPKYEEYHCKSECCHLYVEDNGDEYIVMWIENNTNNNKIEFVEKYATEDDS